MASPAPTTAAAVWAAVAVVLALLLALTIAVVYTGGFDDAAPAGAAPDGEVHTAAIELDEFTIDGDLAVPADTPLAFEVTNVGSAEHDFVIADEAATEVLDPGESETLSVDGLPAGEYEVLCEVPGHEGAGMVATLAVGDAEEAHEADEDEADLTPEEMAAKHDDFDYPVETEGEGNQPLQPEVDDDGTKVFELTAEEIEWEVAPGETREAMAYNGQIPGPRLEVDAGDDIRIVLNNEMSVPTALHFHHLTVPNEMDGVPGLTQDSVLPGESFDYEFTVSSEDVGSQMYHSHFDSAEQVPRGLLGALIVNNDELEADLDVDDVDHDVVMVLNDGPLGYTLNGKGFPATEPLVVDQGDTIRVRYYNEGLEVHPMHLHGLRQEVIARDGRPLDSPYEEDNVLVSPGDRVDVLIEATEPGAWAWHCHVLSHAEGPHGMFGMVSAVIVE